VAALGSPTDATFGAKMNDKEKIQSQLSAYLDGELGDDQAGAVAAAIEQDAELAAELERLRKTRDLVQGLPRQQAGEEFVAQVLAKAERTHLVRAVAAHQASPWRWVRHLATAAIVLIAASLGISVVVTLWNLPNVDEELAANGKKIGQVASAEKPAADEFDKIADEPLLAKGAIRKAEGKYGVERALSEPREPGARIGKVAEDAAELRGRPGKVAVPSSELKRARPVEIAGRPVIGKAGDRADAAAIRAESNLADGLVLALPPEARNVDIYTDDLPQAQLEVEAAMVRNQIEPVAATVGATVRDRRGLDVSNFYQAKQSSPSQVQYVAFVTPQQEENLGRELNGIRANQRVSQRRLVAAAKAKEVAAGYREAAEVEAVQAPTNSEWAGRADAIAIEQAPAEQQARTQIATLGQQAERQKAVTTLPASQRIASRLNTVVITLNYRSAGGLPKAQASQTEPAPTGPSQPATGPANE